MQSNSREEFLAGTAQAVISPPPASPTLGTIQRSTGLNDELFARALVLSDGVRRAAIVCLDLIGMDFALTDEICSAVHQRTGIQTTLLNCSHTHSAPFTIPWSVLGYRWLSGLGKGWRDGLAGRLADLVGQAQSRLEKVTLFAGRSAVQIGTNRRTRVGDRVVMKPNPAGPIVPWVDVLRVDRIDGSVQAVLFSHAAHPVIIHGSSRLFSAEFPGFAAHRLQKLLGGDAMAMFAQGCAADINGDPLRGGIAAAQEAGDRLAQAAYEATLGAQPIKNVPLHISSARLELPLLPLPSDSDAALVLEHAEDRRRARCGEEMLSEDRLWDLQDQVQLPSSNAASASSKDDVQPMENQPWWLTDNVLCLRDLVSKVQRRDERPLRMDTHCLRIGEDWCMLAGSHELFAEYQHWFDQAAPAKHKMMLAYTNGCESYVPTDKELAGGKGYEAATFPSLEGASLKYHHRRALRPGVQSQIMEQMCKLWAV